jgi:hypothetical protein
MHLNPLPIIVLERHYDRICHDRLGIIAPSIAPTVLLRRRAASPDARTMPAMICAFLQSLRCRSP